MAKSHFRIKGAQKALTGTITVRGAKNGVLKAFAASILFENPVVIKNVPLIEDVLRAEELLKYLGVKIERKARTFILDTRRITKTKFEKSIVKSMRASIVIAGPLLAVKKKASFVHPGGCVIGKRSIDIFLEGWKAMGVRVRKKGDEYDLSVKTLKACDFTFKKVSVTATETLMMTAILANGRTILRNCACEPEIPHLAEFLNSCGARISGAGTHTIIIEGTKGKLLNAEKPFKTMPDRIEAGSFAILAAAIGKRVKIKNCIPEHIAILLKILEDSGVDIKKGKDYITVSKAERLRSADIKTREYPGFPTDLQAPFVVLMTQARGTSLIFETVFDGRLNYVNELNRMGANIVSCDAHRVLINGPTELHGRVMESPDIRAGLAFIIAAIIAKGESIIDNTYQINRGYENIDVRLRKLGVDIKKEKD
ncbi:UDP-N-acetylglucosamine 1-carboxyvinyltransferase [Patescibacteria group bacterium]